MSTDPRYRTLLSAGKIGSLELRNRIVMTPMGSNLARPDGHLGERIIRYYEERARGGAGLLIVGVGAISYPAGTCIPNQLSIADDSFVPGLEELTRRVRRHGAKIAIQLQHGGGLATRDMAAGRPMLVPSIPPRKAGDLMRDMTPEEAHLFTRDLTQEGARISHHEATEEDLARVVEQFAAAADRARRAGFDAVELHAGHGYLLASFLSPASNRRTDQFGGDLENRARLLLETIRSAKSHAGHDFPIWCRIDSVEYHTENGITFDDAQHTAVLAAEAGADAIHVSAYADSTSGVAFTDAPLVHRPCGYVEFAAQIKKRIDVPVIAVGRIEAAEAERIISEGRADFIAMGRKLLADPDLPAKLAAGTDGDIRPCIYCYTCVGEIFLNRPSRCSVNPASGREFEFEIAPVEAPKRVLVVGAGPAGMEVARVAALRGHRVTLCERSAEPGGSARLSSLVYPPNGQLVDYLAGQIEKLPIDLHLGCDVTPEYVRDLAPDVTVVAVGAVNRAPDIPGIQRKNVLSGDDLRALLLGGDPSVARRKLSRGQRVLLGLGNRLGIPQNIEFARSLTRRWMPVGRRVVVIGGGLVGVELAEFLAERDREIVIVEEGANWAPEMALPRRWRALHALREHGVELLRQSSVEAIEESRVVIVDSKGEELTRAMDTVIVATGTHPNRDLATSLRTVGGDVRTIGDADCMGYIDGAMRSAAELGRAL